MANQNENIMPAQEKENDSEDNLLVIEEELVKADIPSAQKLDYTLTSEQDRINLVNAIIAQTPSNQLSPRYLEILADYILDAAKKEERRNKKIITKNRMVTVNKRETSFEGLVAKLENGEDGIYALMAGNDKNILLTPKIAITPKDIEEIPGLKELRDNIEQIEKLEKVARGKKRYLLKKQLIEMRQEQYILKNEFRKPIHCMHLTKSFNEINFDENISIDENGNPKSDGILTFLNPTHISALLCNYSKLKENAWGKFNSDSWALMEDLDNLVEKTLKYKYPLYYDLLIYKIDGKTNIEIQDLLLRDHNIKHSVEYISSLWRNKIPKLLAEQAQEDALLYYYTEIEKGQWKRCSRCGEIKLAHNKFFSKNKSSKDGWYSICKCCRNKKKDNSKKTS